MRRIHLGRHLMLRKEYAEKLLSGEKKATVRLGIVTVKHPSLIVHSGGRVIGRVKVKYTRIKRVGELTDEDARLDGFHDRGSLIGELERVYGKVDSDDYVTIIGLELESVYHGGGGEYPYGNIPPADLARIALRYLSSDLSREEREILVEVTRRGSIRLASLSLYGSLRERDRIRRVLKRAYRLLYERDFIG